MRVKKSHLALMAAAVSGLFTIAADAAVTVSAAGVGTGQALIARETLPTGAVTLANTAAELDVLFNVGFGAAAGQDRYVRVDLTTSGVTFSGVPTLMGGASASNVTLVAGGAGSTFAVWQVTASSAGMAGTAQMTLSPASIVVSSAGASNFATAGVAFSLANHETATSAGNGSGGSAQGGALLATIATGVKLVNTGSALNVTSGALSNNTLAATTNFTTFCTSSACAGAGSSVAALGTVSVGLATGTILSAASSSTLAPITTMSQVVGTNSAISIVPNSNVGLNGASGPTLGISASSACTGLSPAGTMSTASNAASIAIGTGTLANAYVCFQHVANSTVSLADNVTFTGSYNPTATGTSTTVISGSTAAISVGGWVREGVSLQAPWTAFGQTSVVSRLFFTNTSGSTVNCISRVGVDGSSTVTLNSNGAFTIPAASGGAPGFIEVPINVATTTSSISPIISANTGNARGSIIVTCVAPADKIQGTVVITNTANGSAVNTPMLRPNTN